MQSFLEQEVVVLHKTARLRWNGLRIGLVRTIFLLAK
jgi:hypothetical protein